MTSSSALLHLSCMICPRHGLSFQLIYSQSSSCMLAHTKCCRKSCNTLTRASLMCGTICLIVDMVCFCCLPHGPLPYGDVSSLFANTSSPVCVAPSLNQVLYNHIVPETMRKKHKRYSGCRALVNTGEQVPEYDVPECSMPNIEIGERQGVESAKYAKTQYM